jgi:hypothetical protein
MTQHLITHALFIFFLCLSFAGVAKAEIVRCIGAAGFTTFSDAPCAEDVDAAPGSAPAPGQAISVAPAIRKTTPAGVKAAMATERFSVAEQARHAASLNKATTPRKFPRDDITLQSARLLTAAMDSTSVHERRRKLATLAVYP